MDELLKILENDAQAAHNLGITFSVATQAGRGQPWEHIQNEIDSPIEAWDLARKIEAWRVGIYTSTGFLYWSSQSPEHFVSSLITQGQYYTRTLECFQIEWHAFLRAQRKDKVDLFLKRAEKAFEREICLLHCEPYFKDKSLYDFTFLTSLEDKAIKDAVFTALLLCQRLKLRWIVGGPSEYEDGQWAFSGSASDKATGLELITFELSNFVQEWSGEEKSSWKTV